MVEKGSLKLIKNKVSELEDIRRLIHSDSTCRPTHDAIRAAGCKLDHCIEGLREFVYNEAE